MLVIVENGENKVILNSWLKNNNYTLYKPRLTNNFDDLKTIVEDFIKINGHCNMSSYCNDH